MDEKLRGLHLEVEKEMLNYDISLLLMKAELSRFATSFTIAGRCELCHLSLLSTTGAGPSSMRNQDQYAVIHISCFPANYSENLLRRHFSIEFVTLTVYTNRSGMYKLFLHPLRSSLRSHYGFIIWQFDMNFRWQICNRRSRVDISGCHTPVYKQHHNRREESPGIVTHYLLFDL